MASSVIDYGFRQRAALKREAPVIDASRAAGISAVCIELVAKPHETLHRGSRGSTRHRPISRLSPRSNGQDVSQ